MPNGYKKVLESYPTPLIRPKLKPRFNFNPNRNRFNREIKEHPVDLSVDPQTDNQQTIKGYLWGRNKDNIDSILGIDTTPQEVGEGMTKIKYPFEDTIKEGLFINPILNYDDYQEFWNKTFGIGRNMFKVEYKKDITDYPYIKKQYEQNPIEGEYEAYPNLPEVTVTPKNTPLFAILNTWYPLKSSHLLVGHSELQTPHGTIITQRPDDFQGYSLFGTNCSTATQKALEYALYGFDGLTGKNGKQEKYFISATPGDTRDYAKDKFKAHDINTKAYMVYADDDNNHQQIQNASFDQLYYDNSIAGIAKKMYNAIKDIDNTHSPTYKTYIPLTPEQAGRLQQYYDFREYATDAGTGDDEKNSNKYKKALNDFEFGNINTKEFKDVWKRFIQDTNSRKDLDNAVYKTKLENNRYF